MAGRPNKFETHVKPRFAEIAQWLKNGATDKEIAKNLGVNPKVFCKYKTQYNDLNELCKNERMAAVEEIKAALFRRATGFTYNEKKTVVEYEEWSDEVKDVLAAAGIDVSNLEKRKLVRVELYEKAALPDPACAMILLKHWDKDQEWTQDPAQLRLKKEELELKKKKLESEDW